MMPASLPDGRSSVNSSCRTQAIVFLLDNGVAFARALCAKFRLL